MYVAEQESETYVRGVKRVDPEVKRSFDMLDTLLLAEDPVLPLGRAVRHAPQDDPRDLQTGLSEAD
jgi:hypothetical protein